MSEQREHSRFGGSVIGRIIACHGSVAMADSVPGAPSSKYADEGTFAHGLGEMCLLQGARDASIWLGQEIQHPKLASAKEVTKEMVDAVNVYLSAVWREFDKTPDAQMFIEQKFTLAIPTADEGEVFGANDCLIYHPSLGRMVVFDYKHGAGVSVSAEDSPQLKFYGAGAATTQPWSLSEIELVVVQPRARDAGDQEEFGVKPWKMDTFELIEFVGSLEETIYRAKLILKEYQDTGMLPNINDTVQGVPALNAGDHCRWCAAAAICPARQQTVMGDIGVKFSSISDIHVDMLPKPAEMDTAAIGKLLSGLGRLTEWASQVQDFAYGLLQQGVAVPGWKLVEKVGRRKWIENEADVAAFLEMMHGLDPDDVMPRKLVTITEVERQVKQRITDKVARKEALDDLSLRFTIKDSSGLAMAPDSDRRDSVTAGPAAAIVGIDIDA